MIFSSVPVKFKDKPLRVSAAHTSLSFTDMAEFLLSMRLKENCIQRCGCFFSAFDSNSCSPDFGFVCKMHTYRGSQAVFCNTKRLARETLRSPVASLSPMAWLREHSTFTTPSKRIAVS